MKVHTESLSKGRTIAKSVQGDGIHSSQLMKLFLDELKDIYWAERALRKALPKMIRSATSQTLITALTDHLTETEDQVDRLKRVFGTFGRSAIAVESEAMVGLLKETGAIMKECEPGAMRDAGIIAATQKMEHYEIATYGTLCQFASTLDLREALALLQLSLEEEKEIDSKLSKIAKTTINLAASRKAEE